MDYSAVLPGEEHPGNSPWASSPDHNRAAFEHPPGSEIPPTTLPESMYASTGEASPTFESQQSPPPSPPSANGEHHQSQQATTDQPSEQQQQQQQQQQAPYDPQPTPTQQHPRSQRYHGQTGRPRSSQHPRYKLQAKVTGLERTAKKDPIVRFDVYTNLPKFRTTQFRDVRRTHSEFAKLGEHLISACPEAMVPAVPPPVTAAGAGTEEDETRVKTTMQRWLNVVCANEVLMRDEEMVFFVESDFGYSPVVRRKQPATGMRRKMIKQFAPPPDDTPELADARPIVKSFYLGTMDAEQKVDKVVKARRALGLSESTFGLAVSQLGPQEPHLGLSLAFRKLGATLRAVGDFHLQQGTLEAFTLSDPLTYHSSDAFIVKETLTNRQILMRELVQAQVNTRSKFGAAERLRTSLSPKRDKVDEAIAALEEAKRVEEGLAKKVADVTRNLVGEQRLWFDRTARDLRSSLREYVIKQIESERRTLATLEAVRPDIRAIDATGGLSRLGRDHHPKVRRSSLASSQGPKGDAWSGVSRRSDGVRRAEGVGVAGLPVPEEEEEIDEELVVGRKKTESKTGSLRNVVEEDDEDRIDARNAASRLAQTTFP